MKLKKGTIFVHETKFYLTILFMIVISTTSMKPFPIRIFVYMCVYMLLISVAVMIHEQVFSHTHLLFSNKDTESEDKLNMLMLFTDVNFTKSILECSKPICCKDVFFSREVLIFANCERPVDTN